MNQRTVRSMLELIKRWDAQLFFVINDAHTNGLDGVMFQLTQIATWVPLYLFLLYLVWKNYRREAWIVLLLIAVTILLTDQITSGLMKPLFHRLRPSHDPALGPVVHVVNDYRGGLYGFASSHAANTMGIAMIFILLFREKYRWIRWLFVWVFINCYTRIYLGVHFPGDILAGLLVGWCSARFAHAMYLRYLGYRQRMLR